MKGQPFYLLIYYGLASLILYLTMAYDKRKSKRSRSDKGRIPERRLLWMGILGGAAGGWLAMSVLRHKTKHLSFRIVFPTFAVAQLILFFYWLGKS